MLGRGVDQILPHPGAPELREEYVHDAREYVALAEAAHGPVPRAANSPAPDFTWPWGEALRVLDEAAPAARVVNLETAVTRDGAFAPGRAVHYRMHPANLPCLTAARPDVCVLANNHVLDFGRPGLDETLRTLAAAGLRTAGAGPDRATARAPAAVPVGPGRRVLVFALALPTSGVPREWAATAHRSGVAWAPAATEEAAAEVTAPVREAKRPGDLAVLSVHWGSNWGYGVTPAQVAFAHALVDGGVDVVHGHSSHHPRPPELYRGRLVLYGCGDFVDDYEGITGYERYRDDLRPLWLVTLDPDSGALTGLRVVCLRARRMRLWRAPEDDCRYLATLLTRLATGFPAPFTPTRDATLTTALP
ncbi:CapA family protein [Streptomyces sp. HNM0574]|nr:CapA family protein [Streptomyces sp. HNM0574]